MINGLDIFYASKIVGNGLKVVETKAKGLKVVETGSGCKKPRQKPKHGSGLKILK